MVYWVVRVGGCLCLLFVGAGTGGNGAGPYYTGASTPGGGKATPTTATTSDGSSGRGAGGSGGGGGNTAQTRALRRGEHVPAGSCPSVTTLAPMSRRSMAVRPTGEARHAAPSGAMTMAGLLATTMEDANAASALLASAGVSAPGDSHIGSNNSLWSMGLSSGSSIIMPGLSSAGMKREHGLMPHHLQQQQLQQRMYAGMPGSHSATAHHHHPPGWDGAGLLEEGALVDANLLAAFGLEDVDFDFLAAEAAGSGLNSGGMNSWGLLSNGSGGLASNGSARSTDIVYQGPTAPPAAPAVDAYGIPQLPAVATVGALPNFSTGAAAVPQGTEPVASGVKLETAMRFQSLPAPGVAALSAASSAIAAPAPAVKSVVCPGASLLHGRVTLQASETSDIATGSAVLQRHCSVSADSGDLCALHRCVSVPLSRMAFVVVSPMAAGPWVDAEAGEVAAPAGPRRIVSVVDAVVRLRYRFPGLCAVHMLALPSVDAPATADSLESCATAIAVFDTVRDLDDAVLNSDVDGCGIGVLGVEAVGKMKVRTYFM